MATFVAVSYGLVTRETSTNGEIPSLSIADDPWINVSALNPHPVVGDHHNGSAFVLDHTTLSAAQGQKIAELRDTCAHHIKRLGFVRIFQMTEADPEPVPYVFPCDSNDQTNLLALLGAALANEATYPTWVGSIWCGIGADGDARVPDATSWELRDLTIPQIKTIASGVQTHVNDAQYELKDKTEAVLAATTVGAVNAVTWVRPNS